MLPPPRRWRIYKNYFELFCMKDLSLFLHLLTYSTIYLYHHDSKYLFILNCIIYCSIIYFIQFVPTLPIWNSFSHLLCNFNITSSILCVSVFCYCLKMLQACLVLFSPPGLYSTIFQEAQVSSIGEWDWKPRFAFWICLIIDMLFIIALLREKSKKRYTVD